MNREMIEMEQAERDLLNLIVSPDQVNLIAPSEAESWQVEAIDNAKAKIAYPMDPAQSQDWLAQLGSNQLLDCFSDAELDAQSSAFFDAMDQLWEPDLLAVLSRKFVTVPREMLKTIADRVSQLGTATGEVAGELADQLIACAQSVLPQWDESDLRVFVRPMVYAMRGEAPKVEPSGKDWAVMSEVEQAKLTLMIAKYAIDQNRDQS
jgi:hypothetical protein